MTEGCRRRRRSGALAVALLFAACGPADTGAHRPESGEGTRPSILLVTLDTTRADRLGAYGYENAVTPHLDALAAESVVYERAVSTSSWTLPAHASLFTGKYAMSHGARLDPEGPLQLLDGIRGPEHWGKFSARGLSPDEHTLAQRLAEAGYDTAAVLGGPWMKAVFGLDAGFGHYDDALVTGLNGARADDVTDRALAWLAARAPEPRARKPFFLFLNYYDPHEPYRPPRDFEPTFLPALDAAPPRTESEVKAAFYDFEIQYLDLHFGRLLDHLREHGVYEETLVVVTADHGELLGEGGEFGHGRHLSEAELHIPLIVKPPGPPRPARRSERVSLAGVFGLVLEHAGLAVPSGVMATIPPAPDAAIVAEVYPHEAIAPVGDSRALYRDPFKLVWNSRSGTRLLRLGESGAQTNVSAAHPDLTRDLSRELEALLASAAAPGAAGPSGEVDAETRRALEALGYLE